MENKIVKINLLELFLRKAISLFVLLFTFLFKRDKSIVVCTGRQGKRFADNSRYMFLYLSENKSQYGLKRIIWLTKDKSLCNSLQSIGYECYLFFSVWALYYHLRAKYFIYDQFSTDYHTTLLEKAIVVNLWHGIPIKKFGLWNGSDSKIWNLNDDFLLTCSDFGDNTIGKSFYVQPEHFLHGMYPRNYYLNHAIPFLTEEELLYLDWVKKKKSKGRKVVLYLPTFRYNSQLLFLGEPDTKRLLDFFDFLNEQGYVLVSKVHFVGFSKNHDEVSCASEILLNLPPDMDVYPFLKEADLLLSDYSSVIFDYLYLNRDIICLPYDLETYKWHDQGLLLDYDKLPVEIVKNLEELKTFLSDWKKGKSRSGLCELRNEWLVRCFEGKSINETVKSILSL